jgi:hypothetical protein
MLIGLALGVAIGTGVGLVGAAFAWPMPARGAIMGALLVIGFTIMRRFSGAGRAQQ